MRNKRLLCLFISYLLLFSPYLLSISGFTILFPTISKTINFLILIFIPGFYLSIMISREMELKWEETLALDIIINMSLSCITCIYLTFIFNEITNLTMSLGLLLITLPTNLAYYINYRKLFFSKELFKKEIYYPLIGLILSFSIGILITRNVIPELYWRGWDPWMNIPISRSIIEKGLNPFQDKCYLGTGFGGFWYFLASIKGFTGISFYMINRWCGLFLTGLASMFVFLIIKRLEGWFPAIVSSTVLVLNPWFINRFSMALRENFAYIFFLGSILLSISYSNKNPRKIYFPIVLSLLMTISINSHPLVFFMTFGMFILEIILFKHKLNRTYIIGIIHAMLGSILLASPFMGYYLMGRWSTYTNIDFSNLNLFIIILTFFVILLMFSKINKHFKFSNIEAKLNQLISIIIWLGAAYALIFLSSSNLSSWVLPYKYIMYSKTGIILGIPGFLIVLRTSRHKIFFCLYLVIALILNFTILGAYLPYDRLAIYISFLLSYGSARAVSFLNNLSSNLIISKTGEGNNIL